MNHFVKNLIHEFFVLFCVFSFYVCASSCAFYEILSLSNRSNQLQAEESKLNLSLMAAPIAVMRSAVAVTVESHKFVAAFRSSAKKIFERLTLEPELIDRDELMQRDESQSKLEELEDHFRAGEFELAEKYLATE